MNVTKSALAFFMLFAVLFASVLMFPAQGSADAVPDISAHDVKQIADEGDRAARPRGGTGYKLLVRL